MKRIILKISGEFLAGDKSFCYDNDIINDIVRQLLFLSSQDYEIGIVLGGGNIFRGNQLQYLSIDRNIADNMGMLATIQNSLLMAEFVKNNHGKAKVFSMVQVDKFADFFNINKVYETLKKKNICFFASGVGVPFFTTDTAAILKAIELSANVVYKGTKVDGIYTSDPQIDNNAKFIENISYKDVLANNLRVMDMTAISLAQENRVSICVFNLSKKDSIIKAVIEQSIGSHIQP